MLPRRSLQIGAVGTGVDGRHYRLVAPIQKGGMGELYLAEMVRSGSSPQRVVIKRLLADLLDDDKYIKMFRTEAAVMARLQHPNIVKLLDTPVIDHAQCLAMEFVYGRNLQQILHRHEQLRRAIPVRLTLSIIAQVMQGLHYAHTFLEPDGHPLQLVHRDVTPGNVLVGYNGAVKLTDFGIAKSKMSLVSTTVGIVKGKARYLAPEQILGEAASPRSDVYSAAVVTVELLSGEPLFERASLPKTLHAIVHGERPDLASYLPQARPPLVAALDRALAVDARRRPPTAEVFAQYLLRAVRDYGGLASGPDVGSYLQSVFKDRIPLPPLGSDIDLPTVSGPPPTMSGPAPTPIPYRERLGEAPITDTAPAPVTDERPTSDGEDGPTFILRGDATGTDSQSPSFTEAISALALVQGDRSPQVPVTQPAPAIAKAGRGVAARGFAVGLVIGIGATLGLQGLVGKVSKDRTREPRTAAPNPRAAVVPAYLDVMSPEGAQVILDGRPLEDRAPVFNIELLPGVHSLEVSRGRYRRKWSFEANAGDQIEARGRLRRYSSGRSTAPPGNGTTGVRRR